MFKKLVFAALLVLLPLSAYAAGRATLENGSGVEVGTTANPLVATVASATNITMSDNAWIGLGASAGRIEFDDQSTDEVNILNAKVGIGTQTPSAVLDVWDGVAGATGGNLYFSDTDVAHGMTTLAPTNAFGTISPISDTVGGLQVRGLADANGIGLLLSGILASPNSTTAAIYLEAGKKNGTGAVDLAATDTVLTLYNYNTQIFTILGSGFVGIGNASPAGPLVVNPPASETITEAATITANGCGTIKQITAAGAVTTNTTNTFTAPAAANNGCCMDVVNVGTQNITLDNNALFVSAGAADVVLGAGDSCRVCSNGASGKWYQVGDTGNN